MGEGNATMHSGGRQPVGGEWWGVGGQVDDSLCWLCDQSKCSIASVPNMYTSYLKQVLAGLPYIKISFYKTLLALS
jgi:hypothetical protein